MFGSRSTTKQVLEDGSVLYFLHEDLHLSHPPEKLDYYAMNTPDRIFIARKMIRINGLLSPMQIH